MTTQLETLAVRARTPAPPGTVPAVVREERAQTRAWLHDRVLQMLEYIAGGGYEAEPDVAHLQRVAAVAADELRAFVEGPIAPSPHLAEGLADVVAEAQLLSGALNVRLVLGPLKIDPEPAVVATLVAATREALSNVRRHAGATRAIVSCTATGPEALVTIRDDGTGFAVAETAAGTGLRHSILGRMLGVGGTALVESRPGDGTTVTLRVPTDSWEQAA